jgi:hypothetical protein
MYLSEVVFEGGVYSRGENEISVPGGRIMVFRGEEMPGGRRSQVGESV